MKQTGHTPGPWKITRSPMWDNSKNQQRAAYTLWNRKITSEEEANANARLIAAAPDLLEALDMCNRALGEAYTDEPEKCGCFACDAQRAARAAIARATGQEGD